MKRKYFSTKIPHFPGIKLRTEMYSCRLNIFWRIFMNKEENTNTIIYLLITKTYTVAIVVDNSLIVEDNSLSSSPKRISHTLLFAFWHSQQFRFNHPKTFIFV